MRNSILGLIGIGLAVVPILAASQPMTDGLATFSQTITERNIFNPNRGSQVGTLPPRPGTPAAVQAGNIQFVGTMSYQKGEFAFFQGSDFRLSQVMQVGDKIAGYQVRDITRNEIEVESAVSGKRLELTIGDGLRQENNQWVFSKEGELPAGSAPVSTGSSSSSSTESSSSTSAPPSSTAGQNDVLKRLMQLREKENQ